MRLPSQGPVAGVYLQKLAANYAPRSTSPTSRAAERLAPAQAQIIWQTLEKALAGRGESVMGLASGTYGRG